jgi:hypothetical protein
MKVTLKIGRLNTQPEFWWFCRCEGDPRGYVLPVEQFREPMSVIRELESSAARWNFASMLHPAKFFAAQ